MFKNLQEGLQIVSGVHLGEHQVWHWDSAGYELGCSSFWNACQFLACKGFKNKACKGLQGPVLGLQGLQRAAAASCADRVVSGEASMVVFESSRVPGFSTTIEPSV